MFSFISPLYIYYCNCIKSRILGIQIITIKKQKHCNVTIGKYKVKYRNKYANHSLCYIINILKEEIISSIMTP